MTDLPPEFTYGYVMGQILLAVGDTADAGSMPDAKAATGKVTIKPKVLVTKTQLPTPATVIAQDIPCTLDAEGYLLDPNGNRGVWLVAGTYTVTYTVASASIPMHEILVTTDHTELTPLWLTSALPPGPVAPTPTQYAELTAQMATLASVAGGAVHVPAHATADRPTPAAAGIGGAIYDSTLSKPIWSDGAAWRDATGTIV
jgi:hypothetical protein